MDAFSVSSIKIQRLGLEKNLLFFRWVLRNLIVKDWITKLEFGVPGIGKKISLNLHNAYKLCRKNASRIFFRNRLFYVHKEHKIER